MAKREPASSRSLDLDVDRGSRVPLHAQLSHKLEQAIQQGGLSPGSLLGNEIELAARLGLSRPTVRQAIQELVDKGLLVRRRGIGTQVVHSQFRRQLRLSSLYDDLEAAGRSPSSRVLRYEREAAGPGPAAALGIEEGAEVLVIDRLRLTDGEPVSLLHNYLPAGLLQLSPAALETAGFYQLMRQAGITLHSARQTIGARAATAAEAALLEEEVGAPLLTMERTAFDDTGRAVEYGSHLHRSSRYTFEFELLDLG